VGLSVTVKRNASANLNANVNLSAAKQDSPLKIDLLKVDLFMGVLLRIGTLDIKRSSLSLIKTKTGN
jgi:hypothetical protein